MSTANTYSHIQIFRSVIQDSLEQCHRIFSGEQETFTYFIEQLITGSNIRHIFTVEGLATLTGDNFLGNVAARNYMMTLDTLFFANLGDRHTLTSTLIDVLVDSLAYKEADLEEDKSKILIPVDILERAASANEIREVLQYNRWLIPLIALIVWSKPVYAFHQVKDGNTTTQKAYKINREVKV